MNEGGHEIHIVSKAVKHFPDVFRAMIVIANLVKCGRWWKERKETVESFEIDKLSMSPTFLGARKRVELKCALGRGRETAQWTT